MNPPDRTLIYRVTRGGHVMGEFDIDRIVELLDSGEFMWTDLCWHQGMSGWAPLASLRSEIAAAKAFPPLAAAPAVSMAGRRRAAQAGAAPVATHAVANGLAGWGWVFAGVFLGAIVGLLTTHFFPTVVQVDRTVEKIVEKPVEVVKVIDRRVEVPAVLTKEQRDAVTFHRRFYDFDKLKEGAWLFKLSERVKVVTNITGAGAYAFSEGLVKAKTESAFRNQGFKVVADDSKDYPFSVVYVSGVFVESGVTPGVGVAGSYSITMNQPVIFVNAFDHSGAENVVMKYGELPLYERSGVMIYGSGRFQEIVTGYDNLAQQAASELRKAMDN